MKYLVLFALLVASFPAHAAGYDVSKKNIYSGVDTMTVDEIGSLDYITVYRVENTVNGTGTTKKILLENLASPVQALTATTTLTKSDCGKTLLLNATTEFATTLPTPSAGCSFRFIVKAAPSSASYTVLTSGSSNIIIGGINELEVDTGDDGPYDTDADTITIVDGVAAVGDFIELISDGTSWYLSGQTNKDGGVVLSTAS